MSREIPQAVRAAAGLAATVLDEARRLPQSLPGLPVRVLGLAMQATMKLQQHYSGLVARGDEVFTGLRGEDEPGMATFDEDLPAPTSGGSVNDSAFDRAAGDVPDEELAEEALESALLDTDTDTAPAGVAAPGGGPTGDTAGDTTGDEVVAVDESGTTVAAATGHRTDVGRRDTTQDDAAIAAGAEVGAVGGTAQAPTDDAGGGSELAGSQAAGAAPVPGYDGFSIGQLRGRLRGYQLATVQDLLAYEEAGRAREPYLRMLRNRLEKLERDAAESSPLAPRGT